MLWNTEPHRAEALLQQSQHEVRERYHRYQQLAGLDWSDVDADADADVDKKEEH
jgi:pyruvate-ferredoxin/flavodoxin oxidoreductase